MSWIEKLINFIKAKGARIGYSTGRICCPECQERTSAMDDLLGKTKRKKKTKKRKKKGKK